MAAGKTGYLDVTVMPQSVGKVRVYWREDYDVAGNYSTITVTDIKGYLWHKAAWAQVYASVTAGDVTVLPNTGGAWKFSAAADTTLRSVCKTSDESQWVPVTSGKIYHNNDGTKTVTLQFILHDVIAPDVGFDGENNQSVSQSITLTEIPRASGIAAASGIIGSSLNLIITKTVSAFTHTLKYSFGSSSGTIVSKTSAASVKWTPPMELCSRIPNAASGTCTIICETYNGSTKVGETQTACKLTVPTSVSLTVSEGWAKVSPYNIGTAASAMNAYVQGYSKASVVFDETKISTANAYGATVKSCRITCGGKQYTSPYRTDVLKSAGAVTVTATVVDSRGYAVNEDFTVTVESYSVPVLSDIRMFRCNNMGAAADDGTYLSVTATANISDLGGLNTFSMNLAIGSLMTVPVNSGQTMIVGSAQVLATATYTVKLTLTDGLGNTAVYTQLIPTADVFFHGRKGGRGAAFGKYAEADDLLDVDWNIRGRQSLTVDNAIKGGTVTSDSTMTANGSLCANLGLELYHATPYIDFHFGNSTEDYTSRIIEKASGTLTVEKNLKVSGTTTLGRIDASNEYLTGSLYVGGKTSTSDGKTGVAFGASGNLTMQGASAPSINFITGTNTSAKVKMAADANGNLNITSSAAGLSGRAYGVNKMLWSGAYYMNANQTVNLTEKISAQPNGIVLAFSAYTNGAANNYDWNYFFVPKQHVTSYAGAGISFLMQTSNLSQVAVKYLYVYDDKITGYSNNEASATSGGITYKNSHYVLRHVIGV